MRKKTRHQGDLVAGLVKQPNPPDNPTHLLLDHPHTGLLSGVCLSNGVSGVFG